MNTILEVQPFLEDLEVAVLKAENLARIAELDLGAITSTKRPSMDAEPAQTLIGPPWQASGEAFVELTRQPSGLSEADSAFFNEGHPNKLARMTTIDIVAKGEENDTKLYKPVMLNNCDQILPFLYLGGVDAVADTQCVVNQGIRAVVCCLRELEFPTKEFSKDLEYYRVDVEDMSREPIELFFPEATEFIHSWISREQPVLVHCRAGVSRSASVVMSYLVTYQGYSLHDAFFLVRSHRSIVSPNLGFMEKLCEYEEAKKDTDSTVDINKYISWYTTPESSRAAVPDLVPE
jgi:dual specificity phosphatase 12